MSVLKKLLGFVCMASLAAAGSAYSGTAPGTGVVGSLHDMNMISGTTPEEQRRVCAYCHTPHHALADPTGDLQPLWSHQYTAYLTNFIPYRSPTLQAQIIDPLLGPSRLCMSCHDGVVAVDQHYGMPGLKVGLGGDGWGGRDIGLASGGNADLSNDHPIGFSYRDAFDNDVGAGLFPVTRAFIDNGNNPDLTIEDVLLEGEYLTCASCHDVHNRDNASHAKAPDRNYFLYGPQDDSSLCLTCHDKGNGLDANP